MPDTLKARPVIPVASIRYLALASRISLGLSVATAVVWALSYAGPGVLRPGNDYSAQWRNGHLEISNLSYFILHDTSDTGGRLKPRVRGAGSAAAAGCCVACGYDLRASAGRCPECGSVVAGATISGS
ncbi:MAG TPA: hypothetical protein VGI81_26705 [Tepidisphaeraceae bacterium]